jgi:hypothetical protein
MNSTNHQVRLAARASGPPQPSDWENTGKLVLAVQ